MLGWEAFVVRLGGGFRKAAPTEFFAKYLKVVPVARPYQIEGHRVALYGDDIPCAKADTYLTVTGEGDFFSLGEKLKLDGPEGRHHDGPVGEGVRTDGGEEDRL